MTTWNIYSKREITGFKGKEESSWLRYLINSYLNHRIGLGVKEIRCMMSFIINLIMEKSGVGVHK